MHYLFYRARHRGRAVATGPPYCHLSWRPPRRTSSVPQFRTSSPQRFTSKIAIDCEYFDPPSNSIGSSLPFCKWKRNFVAHNPRTAAEIRSVRMVKISIRQHAAVPWTRVRKVSWRPCNVSSFTTSHIQPVCRRYIRAWNAPAPTPSAPLKSQLFHR